MGSVVGEITGSNRRAANAASAAGQAQAAEAKNQYLYGVRLADEVKTAMNDPQALARLENSYKAQERQLARQEELINAINPALKEAAMQAAGLLRGEDAAALAPLRRQRERQRQTLLNSLRAQLGSGAESSSAGLNALNKFDAETDSLMAGAQQQTLSSLLGTSLSARPDMAGEAGAAANLANSAFNRIASGAQLRSNLVNPGFQAQQQSAGAGQIYGMTRAQQGQRMGGELFALGLQGALAAGTGGASLGLGTGQGSALAGLFGSQFNE